MTTNHISSLIPSQLPEHIREEYPTFVKFLETYYEFLELEKNPRDILANLRQYTDIDETLDEFVDTFHKQYLSAIPSAVVADKRLLAKHIQDLYKIKGTEKSYQLLFRVLFNEDVELYYPKINILKTSDGKWVQDRSLQVMPLSGDPMGLVGSAITAMNDTGTISTLVTDVKALSPTLYEVFISNNYRGTFKVGDKIVAGDFVGTIMPTVTGYTIFRAGSGFKLGQIFPITSGGDAGTFAKVTRLNAAGGVSGLSLMTFGSGYVSDFYATLGNTDGSGGTDDTPYDQYTHGFVETGFITKADYFSTDYATPDFAAQVIAQFGGNTYVPDNSSFNDDETCVVYMRLGAVANYPGFYKTTDGFLSDANALQDSHYYQEYSYVIKSQRRLEEYKKFVKDILHPAGMKMFGEYQIVNELELGDFLEYDKVVLKLLEQKDFAGVNDVLSILFGASYADVVNSGDAVSLAMTKVIADIATAADAVALTTGKEFSDPTYQADGIAISYTKVVADTVTTTESMVFGTDPAVSDTTSPTDAATLNIGKTLSPELVTLADSGFVGLADYATDYVPPDYVSTQIRSF